jgi:hypothetical protein
MRFLKEREKSFIFLFFQDIVKLKYPYYNLNNLLYEMYIFKKDTFFSKKKKKKILLKKKNVQIFVKNASEIYEKM